MNRQEIRAIRGVLGQNNGYFDMLLSCKISNRFVKKLVDLKDCKVENLTRAINEVNKLGGYF